MTQISICSSKSKTVQATGTVTGAVSSSGLIELTVAAHGLESGDWVSVASVGGVPAATGLWQVVVIDSSHYTLVNSNFSGTYTSGGAAQHVGFSIAPNLTTPGWSDVPSSATLVFSLQSFPTSGSARYIWEDADDSLFTTAMPLAAGAFTGGTGASCDRRFDSIAYDTPDWRLYTLNDYLRLRVLFPQMIAGDALTFSAWIEY